MKTPQKAHLPLLIGSVLLALATPHLAFAQATFQVINNFNPSVVNGTDYFGQNYGDNNVWLYFLNTGGAVSYLDNSDVSQTVSDAVSIPLVNVKNGTFNIATGSSGTRVFAGLGAVSPFSGTNGPGLFDPNVPYALAEWTVVGGSNDNVDVSYEDQFSFPTKLSVTNSNGTVSAGFPTGTKASTVINTLASRMPTSPTGPNNDNYPSEGAVGYGPEVGTIAGNQAAQRWIGSSKTWTSGPDINNLRSLYTYAPSFNDYLQYLQDNVPTTTTASGDITGWYIDYSGNDGYSGYLNITGNATDGFGMEISNIRVNTMPSAANEWDADPNAGDATTGTIIIAANGATVPFGDGSNVIGNWTDATIYSGASLINGDFASGPIVTSTGDFALNASEYDIVPTFLASISASMATGLLGSDLFVNTYQSSDPKSTMYWFNTMTREQSSTLLFANAWGPDQEFYDPFWATLAEFTGMEGYLSPFNDRWSNFSPDFALIGGGPNSIVWELGIPVPEPGTVGLTTAALAALGMLGSRRRRN